MANYDYSPLERWFLGISIVLFVQSIIIAFRVNENFNAHWAIVLIPAFFVCLIWFLINLIWTRNTWMEDHWTPGEILLLSSWFCWIGITVFIILLSLELTNPKSIGKLNVFWPLVSVFAINIIIFFAWPWFGLTLKEQTSTHPIMNVFSGFGMISTPEQPPSDDFFVTQIE